MNVKIGFNKCSSLLYHVFETERKSVWIKFELLTFFRSELLPSITYVINIRRNRFIQTTINKMIETSVSRKPLKSF